MATEFNIWDNERKIRAIKKCGQSLIDNAESIIGNYKYSKGVIVTCYVDDLDAEPYINVSTEFYPEGNFELKG